MRPQSAVSRSFLVHGVAFDGVAVGALRLTPLPISRFGTSPAVGKSLAADTAYSGDQEQFRLFHL
jgi:hypothetical protein